MKVLPSENTNCSELQNDSTSKVRKDAFANAKQKVQKKLCMVQDAWYGKKADEIQSYADIHDTN